MGSEKPKNSSPKEFYDKDLLLGYMNANGLDGILWQDFRNVFKQIDEKDLKEKLNDTVKSLFGQMVDAYVDKYRNDAKSQNVWEHNIVQALLKDNGACLFFQIYGKLNGLYTGNLDGLWGNSTYNLVKAIVADKFKKINEQPKSNEVIIENPKPQIPEKKEEDPKQDSKVSKSEEDMTKDNNTTFVEKKYLGKDLEFKTDKEFIQFVWNFVETIKIRKGYNDFPTFMAVAQIVEESGRGRASRVKNNNNFLGIEYTDKRGKIKPKNFKDLNHCIEYYLDALMKENFVRGNPYKNFQKVMKEYVGPDKIYVLIKSLQGVYSDNPGYSNRIIGLTDQVIKIFYSSGEGRQLSEYDNGNLEIIPA